MNYKAFVRDKYNNVELVPWWKGFVMFYYERNETLVAPIGFNLIYQLIYILWRQCRNGMQSQVRFVTEQEKLRSKA